jgi:formamidopyrimidine-DNA glycosylase
VRLRSPFLLRTASPGIESLCGREVLELRRIGKRIAFGFEGDLWLVVHLMIAGRLHWIEASPAAGPALSPAALPAASRSKFKGPANRAERGALALLDFETGTLTLTEAGTRKRASFHVVKGAKDLEALDPGGLDVLQSDLAAFGARLTSRNHTLKRALTDPRLFSGIGNAYSDEILHHARLSPVALTQRLSPDEIQRLFESLRYVLVLWTAKLRAQAGGAFPENVTAFRPEMAVHGKFGKPCPVCGTPVQRIRYADNETNYCPRCQTGGKLLADRSLSLLLKRDWPRTIEELEELRGRGQ